MADIVVNYQVMSTCVSDLEALKKKYEKAAADFQAKYKTATAEWTGETKNAMSAFVTGTVNTYMAESVPSVLEGLKSLLQANIDQFSSADAQIAENIPK